jgi:hypothetical protein
MENWTVSNKIISYDRLKLAVYSFQPYKSPGMDGIMPIMLQQGFELLGCKLLMLLRASLRVYSYELEARKGGVYSQAREASVPG